MATRPQNLFSFAPADNRVPCGGFNVIGGGIIGKDLFSALALDGLRFNAVYKNEDCYEYKITNSEGEKFTKRKSSETKKIRCDKIRIAPTIESIRCKSICELLIAHPQWTLIEASNAAILDNGKFYNAKDMLNFFFPMKYGVQCIGAIEDSEENQTDGHLTFAYEIMDNVLSLTNQISNNMTIYNYDSNKVLADIDDISFLPYNTLEDAISAGVVDDSDMGLYFTLSGAVLIFNAPDDE